MSFDWNDLRHFLEVARLGRLGAAARRLQVDHTTVGRRITALEAALGAKLFDRTGGGFTLTQAGQRLLAHAEAVEQSALAITEGSRAADPLTGTVRLATMEGIGSFYIAPALAGFQARYPAIRLELVTSPQLLNLTKREADVSLSFMRPRGFRLVIRKIGGFECRLYGAPDYLARRGVPDRPAALADHVFVDYIDDLVAIPAVRWLLDGVPAPTVVFRSSSMMAQQNAAAAGVGLVMLPSFTGARDSRLVPVLAGQVAVRRDLWLAFHEDMRGLPRVRAVTGFLTELIEADRAFLSGAGP